MKQKLGIQVEKILKIEPDTFTIKLRFSNGWMAEVCLEKIFSKPHGLAAEILRGNIFSKCFIELGALAWPNGLEFCGDSLRLWADEQKKQEAA